MSWNLAKPENWLGVALLVYLFVVGVGAALLLIMNFPDETATGISFGAKGPEFVPFGKLRSSEQGLLLLALTAGIAGSFLHAAQSLASYLGNVDFKPSWTAWYVLRPWIGGSLGIAIYLVFRAGIVGGAGGVGADAVNPYGVAALGLLGGWFSKTTADKLQEVFETLFKTDQDRQRKHKLRAAERPVIEKVDPQPVPPGAQEITLEGQNFLAGATVLVDGTELPAVLTEGKLKVSLSALSPRPADAVLKVKNPEGPQPVSPGFGVKFA